MGSLRIFGGAFMKRFFFALLLLPLLACYFPPYYFPPSCHWIIALSALGDTLEIEDGSVWKVDPYESPQIHYWRSSDPLILTQNHDWFSSFDYRIVNQTTGGSIGVNLFLGPVLANEHARFLIALDFHRGEVILTDGSRWTICPRDLNLFQKWVLEDCILIGSNSGWESSYDCILINSNMNHFVRAKQF